MEGLMFSVLAATVLGMALCVVLAKSPLRAALALIVVQCALAGCYIVLQAPFVAAMQVLVYAGAIMVLFLFVIMLLNLGDDVLPPVSYLSVAKMLGAGAALCTCYAVAQAMWPMALPSRALDGSVAHIGALLLGQFLFSFEATSVLLLTAVVGSIVLCLRRLT